MAVMAIGILAAGCSGESGQTGGGETETGSLKIVLNGGDNGTATRAIGTEPATESIVNNFVVFVFHYNSGVIETYEEFTTLEPVTIENLSTAYTKRIVVLVNYSGKFDPSTIQNYSDLSSSAIGIASDISVFLTNNNNGLFMSGETDSAVTLTAGSSNSVDITVARVAAKVRLTSLTFLPDDGTSVDDFTLQGVSMQKVRSLASVPGTTVPPVAMTETNPYWGGLNGEVSYNETDVTDFLNQAYSPGTITAGTPLAPEIFFYVLPNDNSELNATMLTIYGDYNNGSSTQRLYYTFIINGDAATGGDGTFIKRNTIYELSITINKLGLGADNPDTVSDLADITVTITPADWVGPLVQNLVW